MDRVMNERTKQSIRILFAGGGTGGHLYPALAIARGLESALAPRNCEIRFVGSKRGIEYRRREQIGYPLELIPVRPLIRKLTLKNLLFPFALCGALLKSNALMNEFKPDLVVGTGGYVSGPALSRAAARNIPCAIQEQNSYPGLTTRKLADKVDRVYLGFDDARSHLAVGSKAIHTGNPVRSEIGTVSKQDGRSAFELDANRRTVLVLGGSQGARSLNQALQSAIAELPEDTQLLWQTGKADFEAVRERLGEDRTITERVKMFAFTDKMEHAYAAADIAIARAGALTLAELQEAELPAILIPFPFAAGDHQRKNAESIVKTGAAEMILDKDLQQENPLRKALALLEEKQTDQMSGAWRSINSQRGESALNLIVTDLIDLLQSRGRLA